MCKAFRIRNSGYEALISSRVIPRTVTDWCQYSSETGVVWEGGGMMPTFAGVNGTRAEHASKAFNRVLKLYIFVLWFRIST